MILSYKNLKILVRILLSWMRSIIRVVFFTPASYLSRITSEDLYPRSLSPDEWVLVNKTVKGVRKISPLFLRRRKCLMEALVVFYTLKGFGISPVLKLGTKNGTNQLSAHAWVKVNQVIVIGGPVAGYEELIRTRRTQ